MTSNIHTFTFAAFTSSDETIREAAYHALSMLHFDHPLPLATFVSTVVTLGAKSDVLAAAGFDVKPSNVHRTRAEWESLLREWLILVERLSRYITFPAASFMFRLSFALQYRDVRRCLRDADAAMPYRVR